MPKQYWTYFLLVVARLEGQASLQANVVCECMCASWKGSLILILEPGKCTNIQEHGTLNDRKPLRIDKDMRCLVGRFFLLHWFGKLVCSVCQIITIFSLIYKLTFRNVFKIITNHYLLTDQRAKLIISIFNTFYVKFA